MPRHVVARRKHHPVRNVLLVCLLAVLVYAVCAAVSLYRVYRSVQSARASYEVVEQEISSGNLGDALQGTQSLCSAVGAVGDETDTWVWVVGEYLPWLGQDVSVARGLSDVSDELCNDALLPVVQQSAGITSGTSTVSGALDAVSSASEVVSTCSQELSGIGTSHFSQLNEARESLSEAVSQMDAVLGSASSMLSALGSFL